MGWSGIWLVSLRPGESPEAAIERTTAAWIEPDDDGLAVVANSDEEPTRLDEATDRWIERIVALLRRENPRFEISDEQLDTNGHREWVALDDPDGPVSAAVYGDQVQLLPRRGYADPDGQAGFGFRMMWRYCQLLAAQGCVAHDPDDDEMIDLDFDEDEAAAAYDWI